MQTLDTVPPGPGRSSPTVAPGADVAVELVGAVDAVHSLREIAGWVRSSTHPDAQITVTVLRFGRKVGEGVASEFRSDLGKHCGFRLTLTEEIDFHTFAARFVRVVATIDGQAQPVELRYFDAALRQLKLLSLAQELAALRSDELDSVLRQANVGRPAAPSTAQATRIPDVTKDGTSALQVPVGLLSPDGVAVVGQRGHLFLWSGSNDLLRQYRRPQDDAEITRLADGWANLLHRRRARLAAATRLLTVVIPEKSSVLHDLMPVAIPPETALLRAVLARAGADAKLRASMVHIGDLMRDAGEAREGLFRRLDTHFSPPGALLTVNAIRRALGESEITGIRFHDMRRSGGDLGSKFPGLELEEIVPVPDPSESAELAAAAPIEAFFPPNGGHIGRRFEWRKAAAASNTRVLVFGNSFFDSGAGASALSWWFSRLYAAFRFIWTPEMIDAEIEAFKPDVVICQTIERFLTKVPNA